MLLPLLLVRIEKRKTLTNCFNTVKPHSIFLIDWPDHCQIQSVEWNFGKFLCVLRVYGHSIDALFIGEYHRYFSVYIWTPFFFDRFIVGQLRTITQHTQAVNWKDRESRWSDIYLCSSTSMLSTSQIIYVCPLHRWVARSSTFPKTISPQNISKFVR